jgi:hypothetical protein
VRTLTNNNFATHLLSAFILLVGESTHMPPHNTNQGERLNYCPLCTHKFKLRNTGKGDK